MKILIVRLSAIGDVVHVLPAMRALRAALPDAYIGWLVEDRVKDLIMGHPDLDEVIFFPRRKWAQGLLNPSTFFKTVREIIRFFRLLRGWKYDIAIDFQGNLKSGVLTFLSGAKKRIGFGRGHCKEFNYLFTNCHVYPLRCHSERSEESPNETLREVYPERCNKMLRFAQHDSERRAQGDSSASGKKTSRLHKIDKNLTLLRPLGIPQDCQKVDIPISPPDREYISDFLNKNNCASKPIVVIHSGTSEFGSYKRWSEENYARLGDMLVDKWDANVIFTWSGSEYDTAKRIVSLMTKKGIVSCETHSIKQLVELIRLADLFIGGDTGPVQIAAILGTPVVAIFGPKDPAIYGPRSRNSIVVRKDVPCSPCEKRTCDKPICMELIKPEDVFDATKHLISVNNEVLPR